jgi:hypothetical protein
VIDEKEIVACALHVVQRYGEAAWFHAAQRADELLQANDFAGSRTWQRILARIDELQAAEGTKH